jgi:hypothetical protein
MRVVPIKFLSFLILVFGLLAAAHAAPPGKPRLEVPVAGPNFAGTFAIDRFVAVDGKAHAVGLVTGVLTTATGTTSVVTNVSWPVADSQDATGRAITQQATCEILNLVLGPLHLDLLGLVIDLNQVVLNITAVAGAGNLLGNLLCAIVGLLDQPSLVDQLVKLLNQLLSQLLG